MGTAAMLGMVGFLRDSCQWSVMPVFYTGHIGFAKQRAMDMDRRHFIMAMAAGISCTQVPAL
jgi:hypothetical protein